MTSRNRPLSPHLDVYKLGYTGWLSIAHRITGIGVSIGTLLLALWLGAAAYGPEAFAVAQDWIGSPIGYLALFAWTFSLFYHFSNGIRHLLWDAGWGFELEQVRSSGVVMVASAVALTLVTWIAILLV